MLAFADATRAALLELERGEADAALGHVLDARDLAAGSAAAVFLAEAATLIQIRELTDARELLAEVA